MKYVRPQHSTTFAFPELDSDGYATLATGITYYAELGLALNEWIRQSSMHWQWSDATLVAAITVEASNMYAASLTGAAATAGWVPLAAIATVSPAGAASQDISSWGDVGYGRLRAKIVVTTGGRLRGSFHAKKN